MTQRRRCPQLQNLPPNVQQFWEEKQQVRRTSHVIFVCGVVGVADHFCSREKRDSVFNGT